MADLRPLDALKANIRLLEHQIEKVQLETQSRKELSSKVLKKLSIQFEKYLSALNNDQAILDFSIGEGYLKDREHLAQLIREIKHKIYLEERSCWNDLQKLEYEKRLLEREKSQVEFNLRLMIEKLKGGSSESK